MAVGRPVNMLACGLADPIVSASQARPASSVGPKGGFLQAAHKLHVSPVQVTKTYSGLNSVFMDLITRKSIEDAECKAGKCVINFKMGLITCVKGENYVMDSV
jgi:hypothetical protein